MYANRESSGRTKNSGGVVICTGGLGVCQAVGGYVRMGASSMVAVDMTRMSVGVTGGGAALESLCGRGRGSTISELDDIDGLVKTYRARILRFVMYSTGDPDLAETLSQDCLLKAYNGRANFRGDCSVNTWLTGIALNLIRDHQRTQKFRFWKQARATAIDVSDVASFIPTSGSTPEAQLIAKQQVAGLSAILETLSLKQRTVFLLKFSEELDLPEIAEAMQMPVNTVKTHLHRAVKAVRMKMLEQAGSGA